MSRLARIAAAAAAFIRSRLSGFSREQAAQQSRPPVSPPPPPPVEMTGDDDDNDDGDIEYLGRGEQYDEQAWQAFVSNMREVSSSNVFSYGYRAETKTMGILYVTFLASVPKSFGGTGERSGPGSTYAYYDFPLAKFRAFESMAGSSAGGAVWDFCRVRHSRFEHQHTYQLVQVSGDYVPRKATAKGFKRRQVAAPGMGRRSAHARQQLPEQAMTFRRQLPQRNRANGTPNRGRPNRGEPNRG
jgi:hypothetical protein